MGKTSITLNFTFVFVFVFQENGSNSSLFQIQNKQESGEI